VTRILFVTSNGTGLGHLTRGMAIARRLGPELEPLFLTLSAAAPVVEEQAFHVEYFPSHNAPGAESPRRWDRRLRARIELLLEELRPALLVFDGAHPYDGLVAVLRSAPRRGVGTVWCRRPLWQPGVGAEGIYWSRAFDRVLEPGELAESEDRGLTVERRQDADRVPPIVYLDESELLPREQAERELGLEPGRTNALVALGQGAQLDRAVERTLKRLAEEPEVQVAALESSLAPGLTVPEGVVHLRSTYPMSRYYRGFDLAVAAAGYNAFHELIAYGVPSLFVPMPRQLDDQAARARWARDSGIGEGVAGPLDPELEQRLGHVLDPSGREAMAAAIRALDFGNGAAKAARLVEELALGAPGMGPGKSVPGGHFAAERSRRVARAPQSPNPPPAPSGPRSSRRDALAVSAQLVRRVGLRLPLIVARRTIERLRNPPPPPARVVVPALGLEGEELVARLREVVDRAGTEPRRVLAITDSLDFGALRRAGFGFEYVPSEDRAQPILRITGESYPDFVRRRIEAATAARRRVRLLSLSEFA
jgi:spore coat polysaccharide biosynthesis predicted glycosyltransferase SpsG